MITNIIVIALLHMPYDPITSTDDWYAPTVIEYVDQEPTEEDVEHIWTLEAPQ